MAFLILYKQLQKKIIAALTAFSLSMMSFEQAQAATAKQEQAAASIDNDYTHIAKVAIPAVVWIKVKGTNKSAFGDESDDPFGFFNDDFFEQFFNRQRKGRLEPQPIIGQGSGFIVSPDGEILTNGHVVKDMSEIKVILNDGKEYDAKVIGIDTSTDIALIKIDAKDLPYLQLGNSDNLEVGQRVAAIGNPLGLQASMTTGIVSAKGRNNLDLSHIEDYIQTDAAINRGNSGGPLLDMKAKVIGMNTAIVTNMATGGYMGIGFAIPSNLLKAVMEDLKTSGSFQRGYLGVVLQQVDEDLAQAFNLNKAKGALIAEVNKDSPAEKGGLKQGDFILKYNNIDVTNIAALRNAIALMKPGTQVTLSLLRQGMPKDIKVEVGTFPTSQPVAATVKENKLGIEVENLTGDIANKLGYSNDKGVVVNKVDGKGPGAWAGIKKGALILEVNQKKVSNVEEFNTALQATPEGKPVLFLIKQDNTTRYISFKVQ
jgi:serine protease Do